MKQTFPKIRLNQPKVTDDLIEINLEDIVAPTRSTLGFALSSSKDIELRLGGDFDKKALFLPTGYNYHIGIDPSGAKLLIVTKQ